MPVGDKPMGSEFVDSKSTLLSVIPASVGIQSSLFEVKTTLDAGFHRHDESYLFLKARDFDSVRARPGDYT
jgi:hypothetical protein